MFITISDVSAACGIRYNAAAARLNSLPFERATQRRVHLVDAIPSLKAAERTGNAMQSLFSAAETPKWATRAPDSCRSRTLKLEAALDKSQTAKLYTARVLFCEGLAKSNIADLTHYERVRLTLPWQGQVLKWVMGCGEIPAMTPAWCSAWYLENAVYEDLTTQKEAA